jgi:hypothetical protein
LWARFFAEPTLPLRSIVTNASGYDLVGPEILVRVVQQSVVSCFALSTSFQIWTVWNSTLRNYPHLEGTPPQFWLSPIFSNA